MNESSNLTPVPEEEPRPVRAPTEFSGAIDVLVVHDVHDLFHGKAKQREVLLLVGGLAAVGLGICNAVFLPDGRHALGLTLRLFGGGFVCFAGWWSFQKGWARYMLDQVISGRIHGAGIVVDQLDDRANWSEFCSARLSDSAALLFVDEKEKTPSVIAFDGLPLHRSFFESEEEWQAVCQLIRERVRKVSLVARE